MTDTTIEPGVATRPTPGTWVVDRAHSSLSFVAKHLMVTKVRGSFTEFEGKIEIGQDAETSSAEAVIKTASLTTGDAKREHLHSADFLNVTEFPEMRFVTTKVEPVSDDEFRVHGNLTIRDITRPVVLDGRIECVTQDPWGG